MVRLGQKTKFSKGKEEDDGDDVEGVKLKTTSFLPLVGTPL